MTIILYRTLQITQKYTLISRSPNKNKGKGSLEAIWQVFCKKYCKVLQRQYLVTSAKAVTVWGHRGKWLQWKMKLSQFRASAATILERNWWHLLWKKKEINIAAWHYFGCARQLSPTWLLDRLLWATLCADKMPWAQPGVARSSKVEGWREDREKNGLFLFLFYLLQVNTAVINIILNTLVILMPPSFFLVLCVVA